MRGERAGEQHRAGAEPEPGERRGERVAARAPRASVDDRARAQQDLQRVGEHQRDRDDEQPPVACRKRKGSLREAHAERRARRRARRRAAPAGTAAARRRPRGRRRDRCRRRCRSCARACGGALPWVAADLAVGQDDRRLSGGQTVAAQEPARRGGESRLHAHGAIDQRSRRRAADPSQRRTSSRATKRCSPRARAA